MMSLKKVILYSVFLVICKIGISQEQYHIVTYTEKYGSPILQTVVYDNNTISVYTTSYENGFESIQVMDKVDNTYYINNYNFSTNSSPTIKIDPSWYEGIFKKD